jgi:hypothetical protein
MKSVYEESPVVSKMSTLWTEFCGTTSLHGWARLLGKKNVISQTLPGHSRTRTYVSKQFES